MKKELLAWAAGLFDGEGSVTGPYANGMYAFKACGLEKAQHIFKVLRPYLGSIKKSQMQIVIEDAKTHRITHPSRLFTPSQVSEIKFKLSCGEKQHAIAKEFKCMRSRINSIARGRSYSPEAIRNVTD